jgi:hypothetical protein
MRKARLAIGLALVGAALPAAPAEAKRYTCGNYGYPEGHQGDRPVFTREPIVGAGVEGIRTRDLRCRKARPMVRAFWNGRFDCNENGTRCTYFTFRCRNRRLGDEYWAMRCSSPNGRLLAFRFGA